ncbi:hypothetical protein N7468_006778 [Penicillium chermesinum]|uniref:Uncharacterized protein n=1 Tax=Penicillium chermesinum TaxID=63820 RepID=A0A9W9NT82_9EURO|nr:uncharacterized protein N7468_006778 [Penicillium chermesinum]KAJ5225553.1 hypothetical protein N7468_006778 [Penicillium chermesinum]KAJ6161226.1 hypothetical protein N7470_004622 [Penicillium chermesinum]
MDQVKKPTSQQSSQGSQSMISVETYQRRWEQLMEDTNQQIQKIRATIEEERERARRQSQTAAR